MYPITGYQKKGLSSIFLVVRILSGLVYFSSLPSRTDVPPLPNFNRLDFHTDSGTPDQIPSFLLLLRSTYLDSL